MSFNRSGNRAGIIKRGTFPAGQGIADPLSCQQESIRSESGRSEARNIQPKQSPEGTRFSVKDLEMLRPNGRCGFATGTEE